MGYGQVMVALPLAMNLVAITPGGADPVRFTFIGTLEVALTK